MEDERCYSFGCSHTGTAHLIGECVEAEHKANQPVNAESSDEDIRERARELYQKDGEIEIDSDAKISRSAFPSTDEGIYVQAWVWVPFEEEEEEYEGPFAPPYQRGDEDE